MAASLAENGEIEFRHRIGGQHLEFRARPEFLDGQARMPDGLRASHAPAVNHPNVRTLLAHV